MSLDSVLGSALMVRLSFTGSMSHSFWNPQICKYQDSVLTSPLSYRKVQLEKGDSFRPLDDPINYGFIKVIIKPFGVWRPR